MKKENKDGIKKANPKVVAKTGTKAAGIKKAAPVKKAASAPKTDKTAKAAPVPKKAVAAEALGRPVEIKDKKRMTIDLTGELVKLVQAEIKSDGSEKIGISPKVRSILIAHFEAKGKTVKNKC